jgi:hypothetical protein
MATATKPRRTRVERGIYRQPNGRLHFRTCEGDIEAARRARVELVAALAAGRVPASPRLRLGTVATRWSALAPTHLRGPAQMSNERRPPLSTAPSRYDAADVHDGDGGQQDGFAR